MPINTNRNLSIAELALEGLSQREIAKTIGLSQPRISQIIKDDDTCRQALEEAQKAQIAIMPIAIRRHIEMLDSKDEKIRSDMVKLTYKNTGITPSHAQPIFIDKLMINNQMNFQDKVFVQVAREFTGFDEDE